MPKNPLSEEDKALFRQMMNGVKPITPKERVKFDAPKTQAPRRQREPDPPPKRQVGPPEIHLSDSYIHEVGTNTVLSYTSQSIPRRRVQELKSGQIPWEGRLDLHGFRPEAAQENLIRFIDQHQKLEHRCLLIIHGKGSRQGETPVLKNLVNHWLRQFPQILAFHSALARDGGEGAVYVLLRRQRG